MVDSVKCFFGPYTFNSRTVYFHPVTRLFPSHNGGNWIFGSLQFPGATFRVYLDPLKYQTWSRTTFVRGLSLRSRLELRPKALTHNLFWLNLILRVLLNFKMNSNHSFFMNLISIKIRFWEYWSCWGWMLKWIWLKSYYFKPWS